MAAQSLVLCRDPETLGILRPLLSEFDMGVEVCLGLTGARRVLQRPDLKTVIVECDDDGVGFEFLESLRRERPQAGPVVVGIVNDYSSLQLAFAHGANFVLSKPISQEDAKRILRMARGFVTRMVRRFLRIAVHHLAHVHFETGEAAFLLDLSEGGMAVQSLEPVAIGRRFDLRFTLPGTTDEIRGAGQAIWTDNTGRAGIEFTELPAEQRTSLKRWIDAHADRPMASQAADLAEWTEAPEAPKAEPPVAGGPSPSPESPPPRPPKFKRFDLPPQMDEPPLRISTSGWMRAVARIVDAVVVLSALALFWYVVFERVGEWPSVRWAAPIGVLMAVVLSAGYFSFFYFLDAAFPGTWLTEKVLALALGEQEDNLRIFP